MNLLIDIACLSNKIMCHTRLGVQVLACHWHPCSICSSKLILKDNQSTVLQTFLDMLYASSVSVQIYSTFKPIKVNGEIVKEAFEAQRALHAALYTNSSILAHNRVSSN